MKRLSPVLAATLCAALAAAPAAFAAKSATFSTEERAVLRSLADGVSAALGESGLPTTSPFAILPIAGDRDGELASLLKIAATKAGLDCVEGRDDPLWEAILAELAWNKRREDILDPSTLTAFGRLRAVKLLAYGFLRAGASDDGRPAFDLELHVSSIETKRHLWAETFQAPTPPPEPVHVKELTVLDAPIALVDAPLSVFVEAEADDESDPSRSLADALASDARGCLASAGYHVLGTADGAEARVSIRAAAPAFDRERNYVRFDGTARIVATLPADRNRILGETTLRHRAARALGDEAALENLRRDLEPKLREWLLATAAPEKAGVCTTSVLVDFATPSTPELEQLAVTLRAAAAELPGVRDVRLVSFLPLPDGKPGRRVTVRVSYRPADLPDGIVAALAAKRPDLFHRTVEVPAQ